MTTLQRIKHRLGLISTAEAAAENPSDYPIETRSDYPVNPAGMPIVPPEDIIGVFPEQSRWGHKIKFRDYSDRTVMGWITPHAEDGDLFGYNMNSGQIGVFKLVNVDNQRNPADMFFADAIDIGYLDTSNDIEFTNISEHTLSQDTPPVSD